MKRVDCYIRKGIQSRRKNEYVDLFEDRVGVGHFINEMDNILDFASLNLISEVNRIIEIRIRFVSSSKPNKMKLQFRRDRLGERGALQKHVHAFSDRIVHLSRANTNDEL